MGVFTTRELEQEYGFNAFNTGFGEDIVDSKEANPLYKLGELEIGVYTSPDYSSLDLAHSFRPLGKEFIAEIDNPVPSVPNQYLEGDQDSLEQLDRELMSRIESENSPDYYIQVL